MKKILVFVLAVFACACINTKGLFERNSSDFWLNHMRGYATYPVYYYNENDFDPTEKQVESKEIATHTYQRNVVVSADIGQRMVDSQTFDFSKFTQHQLAARNEATISTISDEIHIEKGQKFIPIGETEIDNKHYMLIEGDKLGGILLIDETGHVLNKICAIYRGELLFSKNYAVINPEELIIAPLDTVRTDVSDLKQNFEIIFNGYRNGMIEITYVDADKKAQKYTYKQEPQDIDINGVKIKIIGIYPDRIEYMLPQ